MKGITLITLLVVILSFIGCEKKENKNIDIAFVANLSAPIPQNVKQGIIFAFDKIDYKIDDKKVKLHFLDNKKDINKTKQIISNLYSKNIKLVIGNVYSAMSKASLEYINDNKLNMLLLSPTSSSSIFNHKDDRLIRLRGSFDSNSKKIIKLFNNLNLNKLILIEDTHNKAFLYNYKTVLAKKLKENKKEFIKFIDSNSDLKTILNSVENEKIDGIVVAANPIESAKIVQYLRINNIKVPILLSGWAKDSSFLENIGKWDKDIYFISDENKANNNCLDRFNKEFIKIFNIESNKFTINGYDMANILIDAISKTNSTNPNILKKYILTHSFKGASCEDIKFDKYGDLYIEGTIYKIDNKKFKKVF